MKRPYLLLLIGGALCVGALMIGRFLAAAPRLSAPSSPVQTAPALVAPIVSIPAADIEVIPPVAPATPAPDLRAKRSAGSPLAVELNAPAGNAAKDVEILHALIRQYIRLLHGRQGRPIGNDSDLARVLIGQNPLKLVVLPPLHPALSVDGHLRDRWGTPYFIHPLGRNSFEVRSAGPDLKLFTADDVSRSPRALDAADNLPAGAERQE